MKRLPPALLLLVFTACSGDGDGDTAAGTDGSTSSSSTDSAGTDSVGTDSAGTDTATTGAGAGCDGQDLLELPDYGEAGPWPVGVKTATVGRLTVEVWYPAQPGSEAGGEQEIYDIREALPESEKDKIPDADNPWQPCDCVRDLPLDSGHGPYPVVYFVHGTAGFRTQSLSQMLHWASRGYVVVAADHPGLWLADMLVFDMSAQDLQGDLDAMTAAVGDAAGDLAFLSGAVDTTRVGMAGHSAGGGAVAPRGEDAEVVIPMAAGGVEAGARLQSSLILGAQEDQVVAYSQQVSGYESTPGRKRLVGLANAGHLSFADMCELKNDQGKDLVEIAVEYGVMNAGLAANFLWDCEPTYLTTAECIALTNYATAAALEETLMCDDSAAAALSGIMGTFPTEVGEYAEAL